MITTKEQERKVLEKIRKIVEELEENSYVRTAFEGCFEDAENNIEDDAAYSMKARYEHSEEKLAEALAENKKLKEDYEIEIENRKTVIYELTTERNKLREKVLTIEEAGAIKSILYNAKMEAASIADSSAQRIVELADNPDSAEFRQAVQDNRNSKKRMGECDTYIQRLFNRMN